MKTRKNLMLLVLLSLFVSVGVADSKVVEVNASEAKDDPWGLDEMDEAMEEADEAIAAAKEAGTMEEALAALKEAGTMEEALAKRNATISAILRK